MDASSDVVVVGTVNRVIHVFSLTSQRQLAEYISPISYQTRSIAIAPDQHCFAVGSSGGSIAMEYLDEMQQKDDKGNSTIADEKMRKNFNFGCHR